MTLAADELHKRFGDRVKVEFFDVQDKGVQQTYATVLQDIREDKLQYPVTLVDGDVIAERAVSFMGLVRAVSTKLSAAEQQIS